jgi:hypothetical protein
MFVVQSGRAKRIRKYSILMIFVLLMIASPAALIAIFTLRWDALPENE